MDRFYCQQPPNKHSAQMMRDLNDMRFAQGINRAKADVDNKAPDPLPHLRTRAKEQQIQRERQDQINKENEILLSRMERHFTTQSGVDCHLVEYGPKSLNKTQRENDLRQITAENRRLNIAIQNQQPTIIAAKLESDYQKHRKDYHRLCVNPVVLDPVEDKPYIEKEATKKPVLSPEEKPRLPEQPTQPEAQDPRHSDAESNKTPEPNQEQPEEQNPETDQEPQIEKKKTEDLKDAIKDELISSKEPPQQPLVDLKEEIAQDIKKTQPTEGTLAGQLAQSLDVKRKDDDYVGSNVYVTQQQ